MTATSMRRALGLATTTTLIATVGFMASPADAHPVDHPHVNAPNGNDNGGNNGADNGWNDSSNGDNGGWDDSGWDDSGWGDTDSVVTGSVSDSDGEAAAGAQVWAYDASDDDLADADPVAVADVGEDGTYELDLSEGSYVIGFVAPDGDDPSVYWQDAKTIDDATSVDIADGDEVDDIDATFPDTGEIDGTVTDAAGDPIVDVTVIAYTWDDDSESWIKADDTSTDDDGSYSLEGLDDGSYRLKFADSSKRYPVEYYDNVAKLADAKNIVIDDASEVDGIDATLARRSFTATPTPTIVGDAVVGQQLTAVSGTWTPFPDDLAYQWYADGTVIRRATKATLNVTDRLVGKQLTVKVTATKRYYAKVSKTSVATSAVLAEAALTSTPTVSGDPTTGSTLSANVAKVAPSKAKLSYQWYADLATIKGATHATYKVTRTVAGKRISVKVVAKAKGLPSLAHVSAKTKAVR